MLKRLVVDDLVTLVRPIPNLFLADMPQVAPSVATSMWGLAAAHHEVPVPERRGAVCRCVHHGYRSPLSNDLLLTCAPLTLMMRAMPDVSLS